METYPSLDELFADIGTEIGERRSPFKFLDAYGPEDRGIFFGRDNEIRDLYARFYRGRLLLIYGESGTGKSSLIECGLRSEIPSIDALFLSVRTGRNPFDAVRQQLQRVLHDSAATDEQHHLPPINETIGNCADTGEETALTEELCVLVRQTVERKSKTLVLVFDQFEEFFLFQPDEMRLAFARAVRFWLDQEPNLRLVIGLREEYLARATELEPYWPELFRNRLWIRHLDKSEALSAILGPCAACGVDLEEGLAVKVLRDLRADGMEVELPVFQVVMDSLYQKALEQNPDQPQLTLAAYAELGEVHTIMGRFLEDRVHSYPDADAARQVLKALVTTEGTRYFGGLADVLSRVRAFGAALSETQVTDLLQRLILDRLLREEPEQHWYELSHDALAIPIRLWFSGIEKELLEIRQTLENRLQEYRKRGWLLNRETLTDLAPYEKRLGLEGELAELVNHSKHRVLRQRKLLFLVSAMIVTVVLAFGIFSFAQWREAERQKELAEANFRKVWQLVDDFVLISESTLFNKPVMEPLRKELLIKALEYYQDLSGQRTEDPEMRTEFATALLRVGILKHELGDSAGAAQVYLQVIEIYQSLLKENQALPQHQSDLARSHNNLGILHSNSGEAAEALESFRKALEIRQLLAQNHPELPQYQSDVAVSHNNLGNLQRDNGDIADAQESYRKALEIEKQLVQKYPKVARYQSDLARSHNNLGNLQSDNDDTVEARESYRKAVEIRERLFQEHPDVLQYHSDLANSLGDLAYTELFTNHPRATIAASIRALRIDPSQTWIKINLAHGYLFSGQYAKALAIYQGNKDVILPELKNETFAEVVLDNFKKFRAQGIAHPDMAKIETFLSDSAPENNPR